MKLTMISPIILIAGIGLCDAQTVDRPPPTPIRSVTTEYPALHPFHHTVGETSYVGYYFNDRPSSCSVLIWSKPADPISTEKTTHQQVRIDLNASQTITFFVDHLARLQSQPGMLCGRQELVGKANVGCVHPMSVG
jgi:hypothetical protein